MNIAELTLSTIGNDDMNYYDQEYEWSNYQDDDWVLIFGVPKEHLKNLDCFMVEGITLGSAMYNSGCVIGEDGDVVLSKKVGQKTFVHDDVRGTIHPSNIFYVWAVAWANK